MSDLIGRKSERAVLREVLLSRDPELVVVTGRLDIGKTFLLRQSLEDCLCFAVTGMPRATFARQLRSGYRNLQQAYARAAGRGQPMPPAPSSWREFFEQLIQYLDSLETDQKRVVLFDELPWLASRRSRFVPALEHFWRAWACKQPQLAVVLSGSAGDWLQSRLLDSGAPLGDQVTRHLHLAPFTLGETHEYLSARGARWNRLSTLELYMAIGGIPRYLREFQPGRTAAQAIDDICFSSGGLLRDEFPRLYDRLFEHPDRRLQIVRALADRCCGLTRDGIRATAGFATGGNLTVMLNELLGANLLDRTVPRRRVSKDAVYRIGDPYSLFYLTWIERNRTTGRNIWARKLDNPNWRTWCDYAFESVCLKHTDQLRSALGIEQLAVKQVCWSLRKPRKPEADLEVAIIFDRPDRQVNLCETRYCLKDLLIDKNFAARMRKKREAYRRATGTKKKLVMTLVTTHPVKDNQHRRDVVDVEIGLEALFR